MTRRAVQRLSGGVYDRLRGGPVVLNCHGVRNCMSFLNRHVVVPDGRCRWPDCRRRSLTDTRPRRSVGSRSPVTYGCQLAMTVQLSNSFNVSSVDETLSTNSCTNGQTSLSRDNSWVNEWPLLSDVLSAAVKVRAVADRYMHTRNIDSDTPPLIFTGSHSGILSLMFGYHAGLDF